MIPALILARGGSKGIPKKNLQIVGGKPLIGRCVSEAMRSHLEPVIVWSDSDEVRVEARKWGAKTPERPSKYSEDGTTSEDTVLAFLNQEDPKKKFSAIALLQCTTPFLRTEHINQALKLLKTRRLNSVVSVTRFGRFLGYPDCDGKTDFIPLRPYRSLRQEEAPGMWMENGGIYLSKRDVWMGGRRMGNTCGVVEMGWWESLEIDEPADLQAARSIALSQSEQGLNWVYDEVKK